MISNGMISQTCKGQFAFLPLGQRVLDKLQKVVEDELNQIGAQKVSMPLMATAQLWNKSGRWERNGSIMFKTKNCENAEFCLQPTGEEMITEIVAHHGAGISDGRPLLLYQSTEKFRNEARPEYGMIRSTQFLMNDLYSFDVSLQSASNTYKIVTDAYKRIFFERLGLTEIQIVDAENGDMGGDVSHEYHLQNAAAQDHIALCRDCKTSTLWSPNIKCEKCDNKMESVPTVEVAHTFMLGTEYSSVFNAKGDDGIPYSMNCFGIGLTRLIAASIDTLSTGNAMRLPYPLSPFKVAIVLPKPTGAVTPPLDFAYSMLDTLEGLRNLDGDILIDDRIQKSVGRRLNELNQLGIPHIFVIQAKKSFQPHDHIRIEYLRTEPRSKEFIDCGILNHSQMLSVLRNNI
ncbi:unnamed protein product [Bursaphelenchus xylophilus]|uniref:proline--tRNA ligase n=1 Tax=Bursaphelenchus xylophilus TaxID=6326 RepID=A0A1I7SSD6_BURXY|nr:unnamed protein product [Bursaphelenchus xylophilus]CAG9097687.1 unnamed protein product [Bursaphelenchus xylophilus]